MSDLPGFILVYLALFGVPRLGIHGFLTSFSKLAENVAVVKEKQAEIKAGIDRLEARHSDPKPERKSLTLNLE